MRDRTAKVRPEAICKTLALFYMAGLQPAASRLYSVTRGHIYKLWIRRCCNI